MISIVIPARNAAATIGDQLEAIAGQAGETAIEVIVADNGSTDDTAAIARSFAERLALRVVDASAGPGPAGARNRGAAEARGDLLVFVDADDVVLAGWLAAWRNLDPATRFATGPVSSFPWEGPPPATPPGTAPQAPVHMGFLPYAFGGNLAIRRDLFETTGGFPESWRVAEDVVLSWRLQLDGTRLEYARDAVVARRLAPSMRAVLRQHYRYGRADPRLSREFGPLGAPRPTGWPTARTYLGLIARVPLLFDDEQRRRWCSQLGRRAGRLVGSWRERTWYP